MPGCARIPFYARISYHPLIVWDRTLENYSTEKLLRRSARLDTRDSRLLERQRQAN